RFENTTSHHTKAQNINKSSNKYSTLSQGVTADAPIPPENPATTKGARYWLVRDMSNEARHD
ncbi:hypothetical protein, partial [Ralstonia solanacearum]|uniref:hypothetical protein n=1 Tax=Ralstonia solanacearum TaxID=305 RepID=UPI001E3273BE